MSTQTGDELQRRIEQAIRQALNVPPEEPLAFGVTRGWDSAGHMSIVLEIERAFNVQFASFQLADLTDVPSVVHALRQAGVDGPS
jgi:acyl carrier protein